ncbi:MAG: SO_0444 family Cu/Zn efflux transporter [Glaciecola sp.]
MALFNNFILLFVESAPYLLLGMLIAGAIHQWLPNKWIERTLGSNNSVFTAAVIGAPLPLCSCSVIPVAMGIRRNGASKASTASFLVSTPETGVDSVGITYALMGLPMTIARPIAAIFSAVITGWSIALWGDNTSTHAATANTSCCHAKSNCGKSENSVPNSTFLSGIKNVFAYGFGQLLVDFMKWLLIGLFFAALVLTYVPENWMASYGTGPLAMLIMVAISIPMYICATASTPIAVGLIMAGISPGAALVFMLTGPATNIATLMVIKNELGKRELFIYLVALIGSALMSGFVVDAIFSYFSITLDVKHGGHSEMLSNMHQLSAVILALLIGWQMIKWLRTRIFAQQ